MKKEILGMILSLTDFVPNDIKLDSRRSFLFQMHLHSCSRQVNHNNLSPKTLIKNKIIIIKRYKHSKYVPHIPFIMKYYVPKTTTFIEQERRQSKVEH